MTDRTRSLVIDTDTGSDDAVVVSKPRPDVTKNGIDMIGDYRTDALREALGRAPIEDDTLMALLVLAFAAQNVSVESPSRSSHYLQELRRFSAHAVRLPNGRSVDDLKGDRFAPSISVHILCLFTHGCP